MRIVPSRSQSTSQNVDMLIASVARTNVQLFNQLATQGRSDFELARIRSAYDLAAQLYSGAYQADGKPFVTHVVSVASILVFLDQSSALVAAALLHNVYNNADFGDGLHRMYTERRRNVVRKAVGEEVESLIRRFGNARIDRHLAELIVRADQMDAIERQLALMDLADLLEKYLDQGVLYFGQKDWVTEFAQGQIENLVSFSSMLGQPLLGEALRRTINDAESARIPQVLRSSADRKYLQYLPPLSHRKRLRVVIQQVRFTRFYGQLRRLKNFLAVRSSREKKSQVAC